MSEIKTTLGRLPKLVERRLVRMQNNVGTALERTAKEAVPMIRKRTPKAFGDLQNSVHAELTGSRTAVVPVGYDGPIPHARTVVDAPHAGSVERGTAPHTPNFERLLAWVKLRGMQGLSKQGRIRKSFKMSEGISTRYQARRVAYRLKRLEVRGARASKRLKRDAYGRHLPMDAAERVAREISAAIEKAGTRPYFMVRNSLVEIAATMGRNVRNAVSRT